MTRKIKKLLNLFTELLLHPITFARSTRISLGYLADILEKEKKKNLLFRYDSKYKPIARVDLDDHVLTMPRTAVPAFLNQWEEIFIENEYLFHPASDAPVILDFGANVGTSILFFSKHYPHATIEGYEADPNIYSYLESNMRKNNVNVKLYNAAVWIKNGECSFKADGSDGGYLTENYSNDNIIVRCIDVHDIISKYPVVDFLKIDIEGAEIGVISRLSKDLCKVQNLFIEYHEKRGERQMLSEMLSIIAENGLQYTIFNVAVKNYNPFVESWHHPDFSQQLVIYAYRKV